MDELETRSNKWLYIIRILNRLNKVPAKLREHIFEKLFEAAKIASFTPDQIHYNEDILKYNRDMKNSLVTPRKEGMPKGIDRELGKDFK